MSIINDLVSKGQLTQEQGEAVQTRVDDMMKAAAADPLFKAELEKLGKGETLSKLKNTFMEAATGTIPTFMLLSGAAAGMGTAAAAGRAVVEGFQAKRQKEKDFERMLNRSPELKRHPNKQLVKDSFETLHKFNPAYASDPLVAAAFVKNTVDMERVHPSDINALVSAYKNIQDAKAKTMDIAPNLIRMQMAARRSDAFAGPKKDS